MHCPFCKNPDTKVLDSRDSGAVTRRRRECLKCEKRFTTYERHDIGHLIIVKKDGSREMYDRDKLKKGLRRAVEKRPVTAEQVEGLLDEIETEIRLKDQTEIPSSEIGNLVMKQLKKIDQVAYVRFASVYKEFADIDSFKKLMKDLVKN
jgi:transcriptional repressor NrdR